MPKDQKKKRKEKYENNIEVREDSFAQGVPKTEILSTFVISNSKGLTEILRDIRTSTYQSLESEENNKLNNHIYKCMCNLTPEVRNIYIK